MEEYDNHNFFGNARHVNRNHLLAETAVMCLKAGIEANPLYTPEMMEETTKNLRHEEPYFYFAREIKRVYEDKLNRIRYTRLAGMITFWNGVYVVYNLRDKMPKWVADGENKVLWHMESIFHPLRQDYHPFQKAALLFGADYNIALDLLQQIKETKKQYNGFFQTYNQIVFLPMDDFVVRLLRLITSVNWLEELLSSLFEPEEYTASWGSLQFDVLIDGIETYYFLNGDIRNQFRFQETILMHREGVSSGSTIEGYKIICYPEQLAMVEEFFGDLVEYATVYRADQLTRNYAHDTADKRKALAYYGYGKWVDATRVGLDASKSYYDAEAPEAILAGFEGKTAEEMGKRIADMILGSSSHWSYVGSNKYSYIGIGVEYCAGSPYGWYGCVMVGRTNYG